MAYYCLYNDLSRPQTLFPANLAGLFSKFTLMMGGREGGQFGCIDKSICSKIVGNCKLGVLIGNLAGYQWSNYESIFISH